MKKASKVLGIIALVRNIIGWFVASFGFALAVIISFAPIGLIIYGFEAGGFQALLEYLQKTVTEWQPEHTQACLLLLITVLVAPLTAALQSLFLYELGKQTVITASSAVFVMKMSTAHDGFERRSASPFAIVVGAYRLYEGSYLWGIVSLLAGIFAANSLTPEEKKEIADKKAAKAQAKVEEAKAKEAKKAEAKPVEEKKVEAKPLLEKEPEGKKVAPKKEEKPAEESGKKPAAKKPAAKEESGKKPAAKK